MTDDGLQILPPFSLACHFLKMVSSWCSVLIWTDSLHGNLLIFIVRECIKEPEPFIFRFKDTPLLRRLSLPSLIACKDVNLNFHPFLQWMP